MRNLGNGFIKSFQQANYWPTLLMLKMFLSFEVSGRENLAGLENKPVIFASNHANYLDSPIAGATMPRSSLVPKDFFPLKFIAAEEYCSVRRSPIPFPLSLATVSYIRINGSIPVGKSGKDLRERLRLAIGHLEYGGKLWIYPEGRMTRDGKLQPGKRGVAFLHQATGAPVVPVGILGTHRILHWKSLFRTRGVKVKIGAPIHSLENMTIENGTIIIMKEIARLINEEDYEG